MSITGAVFMLAALVLNLLDSSDWRIALCVLGIVGLASSIVASDRLRRRIERLDHDQSAPTPPPHGHG